MGGCVGVKQVEYHATLWSYLQDCKISSRVDIPKLDWSVAKIPLGGQVGSTSDQFSTFHQSFFGGKKHEQRLKLPKNRIKTFFLFNFGPSLQD